jgi:hypothetical protein
MGIPQPLLRSKTWKTLLYRQKISREITIPPKSINCEKYSDTSIVKGFA